MLWTFLVEIALGMSKRIDVSTGNHAGGNFGIHDLFGAA